MLVRQISVFIENKSGRLAEVTGILSDHGLNIRALSVADTTDFGILRLIVDDPEKTETALKEKGFAVSCTQVIAIAVCDVPGGLRNALCALDTAGISIEYMYAFLGRVEEQATVILRVESPERAAGVLTEAGVRVLEANSVYRG